MTVIQAQLNQFAEQWEHLQGYRPAAFQKAIALRRLENGQSVREIIDLLSRVSNALHDF